MLGTQRGLNGMRKAPDSAVFLSDSNLGVGENNPRAGKLMQRVFGNGWRHTWNLICHSKGLLVMASRWKTAPKAEKL